MTVTMISRTTRRALKARTCWHCLRPIYTGQRYIDEACACDGRAYRLAVHEDCDAMADYFRSDIGCINCDHDGLPPLMDDLENTGEFQTELDRWRGLYPHVVTRIEFHLQRREGGQ